MNVFFFPQLPVSTWPNLGVCLCGLKARPDQSAAGPACDPSHCRCMHSLLTGSGFCSAGPGALVPATPGQTALRIINWKHWLPGLPSALESLINIWINSCRHWTLLWASRDSVQCPNLRADLGGEMPPSDDVVTPPEVINIPGNCENEEDVRKFSYKWVMGSSQKCMQWNICIAGQVMKCVISTSDKR